MKNFLKITWRHLLANKLYTAISILGLGLGISSCILIAIYVNDELSYEEFHEKGDRIYRLTNDLNFNGNLKAALSDLASGPTILSEYPEVENYVRFRFTGNNIEMSVDHKIFNESNIWFTDSTIFDVFTYPLLAGEPKNALNSPNSIVLTESLSQKLFGDQDAMGKTVKLNNTLLNVTGIMEDPPKNTELTINALISMNTMPPGFFANFNQDWFRIGFYTFLLFKEPINTANFEEKMLAFEEKYVQPWADANQIEAGLVYNVTPLNEVHFQRGLDYDFPKGNLSYIWIFSLLAVFILIIASINYVNLSLAQSTKRAKEVGVRKTLGAFKKELILQFLGESMVLVFLATIVGVGLVYLLMGSFNETTGKQFDIFNVLQINLLLTIFGIAILVGLLAGSYPAFILSNFKPVKVLKGISPATGGVGKLQKALIFVQFIFSLFMITATILINDQMQFMRSMNLGFDKENVLSITLPADTSVSRKVMPWTEELKNRSGIEALSLTNLPTGQTGEVMFRIEKDGQMQEKTIRAIFVDENFINVLGIKLEEGRNFSREIATDQGQAFLVNNSAAKMFGWETNALDKRIQFGLQPNGQATNDGKVIGVLGDFHFLSLHNPMEPLIIGFNPNGSNRLSIKLSKGDFSSTLAQLEKEWQAIAPNHPFTYQFFDEALEQNYVQEKAMSNIFKYFAIVSILIASLGLFALISFSIQSRIKEIGIRKVLGASVTQLTWILVKDFIILLLLAFAVTAPINIYLMRQWLQDFAFDVPLYPLSFILALLLGLFLAGLTISYHIFKIAKADVVEALHYE